MKIEFIPSTKETEIIVPPPKPSSQYIPEWYKNKKKYNGLSKFDSAKQRNPGIKSCMPFLDAMTAGYIQETWCDIFVRYSENTKKIEYLHPEGFPSPLSIRTESAIDVDTKIFLPKEFVWKVNWIPKVSDGWSILVTHPFNNIDLPFQTLSGIIDSDVFYHTPSGSLPFYVKKTNIEEEILIPCGTPMYQIIPIKRENWKSKALKYDQKMISENCYNVSRKFFDAYKNGFRKNKKYT